MEKLQARIGAALGKTEELANRFGHFNEIYESIINSVQGLDERESFIQAFMESVHMDTAGTTKWYLSVIEHVFMARWLLADAEMAKKKGDCAKHGKKMSEATEVIVSAEKILGRIGSELLYRF